MAEEVAPQQGQENKTEQTQQSTAGEIHNDTGFLVESEDTFTGDEPLKPAVPVQKQEEKPEPEPKKEEGKEDDGEEDGNKPDTEVKDDKEGEDDQNKDDSNAGNQDDGKGQDQEGEKSKNPIQKRMGELTSQRNKERERADAAELKAKELEHRLKQLEGSGDQGGQSDVPPLKAPTPEMFESYDDYLSAHEQYVNKSQATPSGADQGGNNKEFDAGKVEMDQAYSNFDKQVNDWDGKPADFDSTVFSEQLLVSQEAIKIVSKMDNGAEVLYEMAKNPEQANKVFQMDTAQQAMEIGRTAERLSATAKQTALEKAQQGTKITGAPDPINPNKGGEVAPKKELGDMNYTEFEKETNKPTSAMW